jgi:hypothetical protein
MSRLNKSLVVHLTHKLHFTVAEMDLEFVDF